MTSEDKSTIETKEDAELDDIEFTRIEILRFEDAIAVLEEEIEGHLSFSEACRICHYTQVGGMFMAIEVLKEHLEFYNKELEKLEAGEGH